MITAEHYLVVGSTLPLSICQWSFVKLMVEIQYRKVERANYLFAGDRRERLSLLSGYVKLSSMIRQTFSYMDVSRKTVFSLWRYVFDERYHYSQRCHQCQIFIHSYRFV